MATTSDCARVTAVLNICGLLKLLVGYRDEASEWVCSEVLRNRARNSLPVRKSIIKKDVIVHTYNYIYKRRGSSKE